MNLDGLYTRTTVSFQPSLPFDELLINGREVRGAGLDRTSYILDIIRGMANIYDQAEMISENNFPSGAGIASSASAFAALTLAGGFQMSRQILASQIEDPQEGAERLLRIRAGAQHRHPPANRYPKGRVGGHY